MEIIAFVQVAALRSLARVVLEPRLTDAIGAARCARWLRRGRRVVGEGPDGQGRAARGHRGPRQGRRRPGGR
eukprot:4001704-Pyramimonas_sp.AAC.1